MERLGDPFLDGSEKAAPREAAESTAVNTDPAKHTAVEQAVIDKYQNAVDENLAAYVQIVRDNGISGLKPYELKPVSERAAEDILRITGVETRGNTTKIEARMISHILTDHGEIGKTDHSMRDIHDIARIQFVLDNYDNVADGGRSTAYMTVKPNGKHGLARTVVFSKSVNGTYYIVEAVPNTKAKTVFIVSVYMKKNKSEGT